MTASTTHMRVSVRLKERLEAVLSNAGERASYSQVIVRFLDEILDQLEAEDEDLGALPYIIELRSKLGRTTLEPSLISQALIRIEERLSDLEKNRDATKVPKHTKKR